MAGTQEGLGLSQEAMAEMQSGASLLCGSPDKALLTFLSWFVTEPS